MVTLLNTTNKWDYACSLHVHKNGFTFHSAHANPHRIYLNKATVEKLRSHWFSFSGKALTLRRASAYIARLHVIAKQDERTSAGSVVGAARERDVTKGV